MTYVIVVILSVIAAFLALAIECANGNIVHVRNGREPNAGAAVFPNIPFVPATAVAVTWFFNIFYPLLGFWIVVVLVCIYVPYGLWSLRRLSTELQSLITVAKDSAERQPK